MADTAAAYYAVCGLAVGNPERIISYKQSLATEVMNHAVLRKHGERYR